MKQTRQSLQPNPAAVSVNRSCRSVLLTFGPLEAQL